MTKEYFWILFEQSSNLYFSCLIVVFCISLLLILPIVKNILHPLFFFYIFNYSFAGGAVAFLYFLGYIERNLFVYFFTSQILFVIGIFVSRIRLISYIRIKDSSSNRVNGIIFGDIEEIFKLATAVLLVSSLITYLFFGLPFLQGSRWELYSAIPGMGVINRLIDSSKVFIIFWLTYKVFSLKEKIGLYGIFAIFLLIATGFLSGSKMSIFEYILISYIAYTFIAKIIIVKEFKINTALIVVMILALVSSAVTVYVNQYYVNQQAVNPFILLLQRLVMSGDLQIMAYSNNVIETFFLPNRSIFEILLFDLKGLFNLFGVNFESRSLGLEVMYFHYPYLDGVTKIGPASTYETFFLVNFGYSAGLILSALSGLVVGNFINPSIRIRRLDTVALSAGLSYFAINIIYNPQVALGKIIFLLLFYSLCKVTISWLRVMTRKGGAYI